MESDIFLENRESAEAHLEMMFGVASFSYHESSLYHRGQ